MFDKIVEAINNYYENTNIYPKEIKMNYNTYLDLKASEGIGRVINHKEGFNSICDLEIIIDNEAPDKNFYIQ